MASHPAIIKVLMIRSLWVGCRVLWVNTQKNTAKHAHFKRTYKLWFISTTIVVTGTMDNTFYLPVFSLVMIHCTDLVKWFVIGVCEVHSTIVLYSHSFRKLNVWLWTENTMLHVVFVKFNKLMVIIYNTITVKPLILSELSRVCLRCIWMSLSGWGTSPSSTAAGWEKRCSSFFTCAFSRWMTSSLLSGLLSRPVTVLRINFRSWL